MNSKRYSPILVATLIGAIALTAAKPAFGADIYNSNGFEGFALAPLVGQDQWVVGPPNLSPDAAVVSIALPFAGSKSVEVRGENLLHQDFIGEATGGYYDAIGSYRRPVNYVVPTPGVPIIHLRAAVRVDGPLTPGNNFFSASIAARAPSGAGIGELAISSDGHAYGYSGDDLVPTFQASAPITLGQWHVLDIQLNFVTHTYMFFVDGSYLGGGPAPFRFPADFSANELLRGSFVAYAGPETATLHKSNYAAHYDNFTITTP